MPRAGTRTIPAPDADDRPATDLGRVEIAKHGNLYLLTDGQGDILQDGRGLGLYDLDTRILSTSILRLNGERLTLLRGPHASDGADTIQLTNPEPRHNPHDKQADADHLARRDLSVTRTRRIDGRPPRAPDDRELLVDDAVDRRRARRRGRHGRHLRGPRLQAADPRHARGRSSSTATPRGSPTTGSMACAGRPRSVPRTAGASDPVTDTEAWPAAAVMLSWHGTLPPRARMTVGWRVEAWPRTCRSGQGEARNRLRDDARPRTAGSGSPGAKSIARGRAHGRRRRRRRLRSACDRGRSERSPRDASSGGPCPRSRRDNKLLDQTHRAVHGRPALLRNDGPVAG